MVERRRAELERQIAQAQTRVAGWQREIAAGGAAGLRHNIADAEAQIEEWADELAELGPDGSRVQPVTVQNFGVVVNGSAVPVLLDFWADWCAPCKQIAPIVEELAQQYNGRLWCGAVDVDAQPEIATRFGVMTLPALCIVAKGTIIADLNGTITEPMLREWVAQTLETRR